ncbi:MAG: molecular chaperone DnaK, partial [Clostridia bacterium]|nr:molecular chaperone DnaK [Clostridia bacterium]
AAVEKVKSAISSNDTDTMKQSTEELQQVFYKVSEKIYKQNPDAFNQGQAGQGGNASDDTVVDDN